MQRITKARLAAALAGAVNGLFGGGGGLPLTLLLSGWAGLDEKKALANSTAVILPLCALSSAVYALRGALPLEAALPYLAGGLVGGLVGGASFRFVPEAWLHRIFALFLLYGAARYLL